MTLNQLRRIRWAVRAVLFLGVTVSVTANILHAVDNLISQAIAAWPPIALLLTVELISRIPVHRRSLAFARLVATAIIAGIAAWVSYWHMAGVAARYGETGASPYLMPVSVDGLVVVASICLVELAGRIRDAEVAVKVAQQAAVAEVPAPAPAKPAESPASAPPAADAEPVSGAPAADDSAGLKVRQDTRSAQQIEDAVRAMRAADPKLSQRKIAESVMVPPTTVRRILQDAKAAEVAQLNGHLPELVGELSKPQ